MCVRHTTSQSSHTLTTHGFVATPQLTGYKSFKDDQEITTSLLVILRLMRGDKAFSTLRTEMKHTHPPTHTQNISLNSILYTVCTQIIFCKTTQIHFPAVCWVLLWTLECSLTGTYLKVNLKADCRMQDRDRAGVCWDTTVHAGHFSTHYQHHQSLLPL